jgi:hypothetical protein
MIADFDAGAVDGLGVSGHFDADCGPWFLRDQPSR